MKRPMKQRTKTREEAADEAAMNGDEAAFEEGAHW